MAIREFIRGKKRERGIPEGVIERATPIMAITRRRIIIPLEVLKVSHGVAEGPEAGVWYRVDFPEPVRDADVVAVGEAKAGEIRERMIDKVSDISFKEIIRATRDDFNSSYYCDLVASGARDRVHELDLGFLLNPVKAIIADTLIYWAFYAGWATMGWILNVLWDSFIQPQIDKVRDSINETVRDANAKINAQTDKITGRINLVLKDLYSMWGLPYNLAMAPVHIRGVTDAGFEWLSLGGMAIHWIAVGERV